MKDPLPRSYKYALLCSMHYALCTLLYGLCTIMLYALCSILYPQCAHSPQVPGVQTSGSPFCGWLKTPLLSQQRSQSCIFRDAGAVSEIVHGDLSSKIVSALSSFLRQYPPLVQLVACQLGIIYRGVGGGHSKYTPSIIHYKFTNTNTHPRSYITNSGRRGIYRTQRNRKRHSSVLQNPLLIVSSIIYRQAG